MIWQTPVNNDLLITLTLYDPHLASVNTLNISTLLVGRGQKCLNRC